MCATYFAPRKCLKSCAQDAIFWHEDSNYVEEVRTRFERGKESVKKKKEKKSVSRTYTRLKDKAGAILYLSTSPMKVSN